MKNKINIADLLKDCPQGMELDCPMFENLEFDHIEEDNIICRVKTEWGYYNTHTFTEYGHYSTEKYSKCVIFPKGKTTWEGFQRPFNNGDVIYTDNFIAILSHITEDGAVWYHCYYCINKKTFKAKSDCGIGNINYDEFRIATEAEKAKLFQAIKDNGYTWNEETKTLKKLIEPIFKVGDRIKEKQSNIIGEIIDVQKNKYNVRIDDKGLYLYFREQDNWELVPNKFDVRTLKPFDKVLVRNTSKDYWMISMFGYISKGDKQYFMCIAKSGFYQCIPYEKNEHLLGTTDDCNDFYKTWE